MTEVYSCVLSLVSMKYVKYSNYDLLTQKWVKPKSWRSFKAEKESKNSELYMLQEELEMKREEFYALPTWKQSQIKQALGLFWAQLTLCGGTEHKCEGYAVSMWLTVDIVQHIDDTLSFLPLPWYMELVTDCFGDL